MYLKNLLLILTLLTIQLTIAQEKSSAAQFWENLKKHCGKSYEGTLTSTPPLDEFAGKKLVMHVRTCDDNTIRIPFFVGEDKSRTWVLTFENNRIQLKHDHRHEDGSEDKVTMYGGTSTNSGLPNLQMFPADQQTADLIAYASNNVWWITLDDKSYSYNLRRTGSDKVFTVTFDLTKVIPNPSAPWGTKE